MRGSIAMILSTIVLTVCTVSAHTWYVTPDGTGDVPTIQAAVDKVAPGDTVLLASGVFRGAGNYNIVVPTKSFVIMSETGDPDDCIIDCEGHLGSERRGFNFQNGWAYRPVVDGVTIRNGRTQDYGGAVLCDGTLTMRNCVFESNVSGQSGGVIAYYFGAGESMFKKCKFVSNEAADWGGAIRIEGVELWVTVDSCVFYDNEAELGGAVCCGGHEAIAFIRNSVFVHNSASEWGGAIGVLLMQAEIDNCTFFANSAPTGSGIATASSPLGYPAAWVRRCIIAYGTGGTGYDQADYPPSYPYPQCINIYGNEGGDWIDSLAIYLGVNGNFSACPSFCNRFVEPYDLGLCDQSPCLPGNHPDGADCGLVGALGEACVCGPTRREPTTWSAIKAMYR